MIKYLKCTNHKGITELTLEDLGQTNVICGRNSSGKTSILEAINNKDKFKVGVEVIVSEDVISKFEILANQYSTPSPKMTKRWFESTLKNYLDIKRIWYQDEEVDIEEHFRAQLLADGLLSGYANSKIFDFRLLFKRAIESRHKPFDQILIPPKRTVNCKIQINFNETLGPNGTGLLNKLFFLKNQELKTEEHKTYHRIYNTFKEITDYTFNIIPDQDNFLTLLFNIKNQSLEAEQCGLGLRDLLVIITNVLATSHNFYLIEEPENHLHADFQKKLFHFFKSNGAKQFLLSTHSSVFLDATSVDKIYYAWYENEVKVSDKTTVSKIVNSLGMTITDNITSDAIILTEGPSDIPIIQKLLDWTKILSTYNVKLWPIGGDIMGDLDLSLFENRKNVFAIIDKDPGSGAVRKRFQDNCKKAGIQCFRLKNYSIENYLTLEAIRKVFKDQIPDQISELRHDISVDIQLGFASKKKTIKGKLFAVIDEMTLADFEGTDLLNFIKTIKKEIKKNNPSFAIEE